MRKELVGPLKAHTEACSASEMTESAREEGLVHTDLSEDHDVAM